MLGFGAALQEKFDFENAAKFYVKAAESCPDDEEILDMAAESLLEAGEPEKALEMLQKSIAVAPEGNFEKYSNLGQLLEGFDALHSYQKATQLLQRDMEKTREEGKQEEYAILSDRLASMLCTITDLYLTDLCYEENAESECERLLAAAMQAASELNMEPVVTLASVRISQQRPEEAEELLVKAKGILDKIISDDANALPSYSVRTTLLRLLIEMGRGEEAVDVSSNLLDENDQVFESWYLRAFAFKVLDDPKGVIETLSQAHEVLGKAEPDTPDMVGAMEELMKEAIERAKAKGIDPNEKEEEGEEEEEGGEEDDE